ncbi:hypothetical protein ACH4A8_27610 [Streptomyces vietnamensis]|uniref:hypothetical protein n=1 Tax=Streptomyces vietnamensis TaxID=362257 RepID=UPI0037AFE29D
MTYRQSVRAARPRLPHPWRVPALAGLAAGAAVVLPAPLAHADPVAVPCSAPALRAAVTAANSRPAPDGGTARGGGLSLGPTGRVTLDSSTVRGDTVSVPGCTG